MMYHFMRYLVAGCEGQVTAGQGPGLAAIPSALEGPSPQGPGPGPKPKPQSQIQITISFQNLPSFSRLFLNGSKWPDHPSISSPPFIHPSRAKAHLNLPLSQ